MFAEEIVAPDFHQARGTRYRCKLDHFRQNLKRFEVVHWDPEPEPVTLLHQLNFYNIH